MIDYWLKVPSQALSEIGNSSVVNIVSADGLLPGSINFYYYLVMCVLTVIWLAALILNVFLSNKILKKIQKFVFLKHVTVSAQH